ncbi:MAG TPA: (d)CMP kinase [Patescibacteria group bacterium]
MSTFHIAIDGPVSAGKGTISKLTAERLGFVYIDTGAMYRMTALIAKRHQIDFAAEEELVAALRKTHMDMHTPNEDEKDGRLVTVTLDGEDVSWKIRTEDISIGSSKVASLPQVRAVLVEKQQQIAEGKNVVMEGRDITYRVLPNAELKIYLTASDVVRAKRRHLQLLAKGEDISFEEVYKELLERDERDMNRLTDPLKIVDDAWQLDTTDLAIEQVVELIVGRVRAMRKE